MGWTLRPFVGAPDQPVRFFRGGEFENAYVIVARMIWEGRRGALVGAAASPGPDVRGRLGFEDSGCHADGATAMRLPRFRFTLRRMMVAVAIVGTSFGVELTRRVAAYHRRVDGCRPNVRGVHES